MFNKSIDKLFYSAEEQELAKLKQLFKRVNQKQMRKHENLITDMIKTNRFKCTKYDIG
jgi:hypothetical protein